MGVPAGGTDGSSCVYIPQWAGMPADQLAATIANIIIAVVGILSLAFYGAHSYLSTCGWEEVYVCVVERECNKPGSTLGTCCNRQRMQHVGFEDSSAAVVDSACHRLPRGKRASTCSSNQLPGMSSNSAAICLFDMPLVSLYCK